MDPLKVTVMGKAGKDERTVSGGSALFYAIMAVCLQLSVC